MTSSDNVHDYAVFGGFKDFELHLSDIADSATTTATTSSAIASELVELFDYISYAHMW